MDIFTDRGRRAARLEIAATVARLRRDGSYEHFLSAQADADCAEAVMLLQAAVELSDRDADRIVATLPGDVEPLSMEEARVQADRVIARLRGGEDDEGEAGVLAEK